MGNRVNIVDFNGLTKSVPEEDVAGELARGGRLESAGESGARLVGDVREQEFGGVSGGAAAVGAGLARGLTFGGSDWLLRQGGVAPETLSGLREENPWLSTGAELAGAVVPGLFSGGAGTAGSLARLAPSGALVARTARLGETLGGLRGLTTAAALEGAAFGAAQGVTNLALSNQPLTAEAALSEIGVNTVLGLGAGVAGGLGAGALGKLAARWESRTVANAGKFAAGEAESALGWKEAAGNIRNATRDLGGLADDILDTANRHSLGSAYTGSPAQLGAWKRERLEMLLEYGNKARATGVEVNIGEQAMRELNRDLAKALRLGETGLTPGTRVAAKNLDAIEAPLKKLEGSVRKLTKRLDDKLGTTNHAEIKAALDDLDNGWHVKTGSGQRAQRQGPVPVAARAKDPELKAAVEEVLKKRSAFRDAWGITGNKDTISESTLRKVMEYSPARNKAAKDLLNDYWKSLDVVARRLPDAELLNGLGQSADAFKAALGSAVPGEVSGQSMTDVMVQLGLLGAANQAIPDIDGPADDLLKLYLAGKLMTGGGRGVLGPGVKHRWAKMGLGAVGARAGGAASKVFGGGSSTGFIFRSEGARVARGLADLSAKSGSMLVRATGSVLNRVESAGQKIVSGGSKVLRRSAPATLKILNEARLGPSEDADKKHSTAQEAFKARSTELTRFMANPLASQQAVYDALGDVRAAHPLVADQMEMKVMEASAFAYEKMPKDPGTINTFGISRWKPSEQQLNQWAGYLAAINDPVSVLEDVANGSVSPQGAEVLQKLYPNLFFEAQRYIAENSDQLVENTDYDLQNRLGILFGVPVNSTSGPEFLTFQNKFWADRMANQPPLDPKNFAPNEPSDAQQLLA